MRNRSSSTGVTTLSRSKTVFPAVSYTHLSAAAGAPRALDALVYTSGGLTSLLNQMNAAPKLVPAVSVVLAGGVSSITTGATVTVNAVLAVFGSTQPSGTVTFFAGATEIGSSSVTDGTASITAPITGSGAVVILSLIHI